MSTRNKKKINVERVGNSGHPITTNPTPVKHVMFQDKIPYTTFSNGTVVQSTVNKDGVNEQILRKSNLNPAYKLEVKYDGVSTPDTLGLYRANHPSDFWAYDRLKPGTKEYEEAVEKFSLYGIPLATYGEAYDNLEEVERQVNELQKGGEVPSNDQQQLFIAIITDMAKTLGVEPSQKFAEAVITAFENQDDSQGLLTLFTKTKNKFMNETGLFREGGKMSAFVEKFKCGGKSPKKKTSKKQEGGEIELSRRTAKDLSKINKGYNNANFRTAYRTAKSAIADNTDLRGREKRMAARRMVAGIPNLNQSVAQPIVPSAPALAVETPTLNTPAAISAPAVAPVSATPKWTPTNASINKGDETYTVQAGNTIGQIVSEYNRQNGTNLKWQDVMKWNNISDPKRMQIGYTIRFSDPTAQATPATPAAAPSAQQTVPARPAVPADTTARPAVDTTVVTPVDSTARPGADTTAVTSADTTGAAAPQAPVQNNAYYEWLRRQVGMSGVWPNGQVPTLNVPVITMPSFDYSKLPE